MGRLLGRDGAHELAACGSLQEALGYLAATGYGPRERLGDSLAEAQWALAETVLLRLRILAAWLPPAATGTMRSLAGWFELANIEARLAYLLGDDLPRSFDLGSLALAWHRLAQAPSVTELRASLAASPWGDPGSEEPEAIHRSLRHAWSQRLLAELPEAAEWIYGAMALLVAREALVGDAPALPTHQPQAGQFGAAWTQAATVRELAAALPRAAAWVLEGVDPVEELWRAEARWWARIDQDARAMARRPREGRAVVVGSVALTAVDAWRVGAALQAVARGAGQELEEVLAASP
jgi:hypothetical protein